MSAREPRWFVYHCGNEEDGGLTVTVGPTRTWVKLRMEVKLVGETWPARLVYWSPAEPSQQTKDEIAEGKVDGRRHYHLP